MRFMGIELGSTRVKAVVVDETFATVASGFHAWENRFENGWWTYPLEEALAALRSAFAAAAADFAARTGSPLDSLDAIGVSGMMHGYLPFDSGWNLLAPFRTWRNTSTAQAAGELSRALEFNMPQRWSAVHYHQARTNGEEHVSRIAHLTTLAGWAHRVLSGRNVLGVDDASGMFPVSGTGWDCARLEAYRRFSGADIAPLLPEILPAGANAGVLTEEGARLLDPSGVLRPGALMAPPEGDGGTGMVATNAVAARTGNVSAGTSIFAMAVLDRPPENAHPQIDVVSTPAGRPVAMVHCNNCTGDINAWVSLFGGDFDALFRESLSAPPDCGGVATVPYVSGEHIAGLETGMPLLVREPSAALTRAGIMRASVYSAFATLKMGMDILARENLTVDSLTAHGGLFTTPGVAQQYLADALGVPVTCLETAGEGGAWGMAVLAAYAADSGGMALEEYLAKRVFASGSGTTLSPDPAGSAGFAAYMKLFAKALDAEKTACGAP